MSIGVACTSIMGSSGFVVFDSSLVWHGVLFSYGSGGPPHLERGLVGEEKKEDMVFDPIHFDVGSSARAMGKRLMKESLCFNLKSRLLLLMCCWFMEALHSSPN